MAGFLQSGAKMQTIIGPVVNPPGRAQNPIMKLITMAAKI